MAKYDNFIGKVYNLNRTIAQWLGRLMGHFIKINLFWGRYNSDRNAECVPFPHLHKQAALSIK